ncbi:predicted protein [Chaetomium globosum CBS 148.51]|uniref:Uncharacterized protein n=1 Tax=Chaetomium globosum (strain ATCC 6205 / CBS 148.51 / DSM 1962 / NBRC 6347 / NRRL 1970) TaxID=306901 RepID=Q2HI14_CHAGB|nr:uncharacterized protein CHGG_00140 [Chaetomium globosum CBS 148.51]EAQ91905.1 predicted protein [Chaetomium globosum CBS 148.51]
MIRLRELQRDTGERISPHAESPDSILGDEEPEPDTTGPVAAVNREIEPANVPVSVTVGITPPRATDEHTPESTSGSSDQETPPHQPEANSNFSRFLDKIGLTSTTLGATTWLFIKHAEPISNLYLSRRDTTSRADVHIQTPTTNHVVAPRFILGASLSIVDSALPILSATKGLNDLQILLLSTSLVVLAPLSAEISDVAANAALAMTSMACFTLLPQHLRQPGSLHKEILQEEWTLRNGITMRRIGTLPDGTLEQGVVYQRDNGPQETEFPGKKAHRRRTKHNKMALKTGDVAPEQENAPTVEERVANDSSAFLSAISASHSLALNSPGLWLAHSLSGDLGVGMVTSSSARADVCYAVGLESAAKDEDRVPKNFLFTRGVPEVLTPACECGEGRETAEHLVVWCLAPPLTRRWERTGIRTRRDFYSVLHGINPTTARLARRILDWLMDTGKLPMYSLARRLELETAA